MPHSSDFLKSFNIVSQGILREEQGKKRGLGETMVKSYTASWETTGRLILGNLRNDVSGGALQRSHVLWFS